MKHTNKNKTKRIILKTITYIMAIIFMTAFFVFAFTFCCLDFKHSIIPLAALVVSGSWLGLMIWANI